MGMFSAIARVFGTHKDASKPASPAPTVVVDWDKKAAASGTSSGSGTPAARTGSMSGSSATTMPKPQKPVRIDLKSDDHDGLDDSFMDELVDDIKQAATQPRTQGEEKAKTEPTPAPVTELVRAEEVRNSLRDELRDSYERAISLAERVDRHLDTQEERSRRLLEIAENLPAALESLSSIGTGQAELRSAVTELSTAFREGQASTQKGLAMQLESLGRVEGLIAEATDSQREIRASIENLSSAFEEITASNKRLGDTLTDMKRRDAEREERLQEANTRTHKLLMGLAIGGGILGGLAVLALVAQVVVPLVAGG